MKRFQLSLLFLCTGISIVIAQVGINNNLPFSTLDISAKNPAGNTTDVDGLLIPRVDRQRAQSMTAMPNSTLIYVNNINTGTLTGTAVNIDATGYYYFDGTAWSKLGTSVNVYNSNGVLKGTRTIATNGNPVLFTNEAAFVAFVTNQGLGTIGTSGFTKGSMTLAGGDANLDIYVDDANQAQVNSYGNSTQLSIGTVNAAPLTLKSNDKEKITILSNGNVGIGTSAPNTKLEVSSGTANISGLRLTNLTSASPIGAGQPIGVDTAGNIITIANSAPASINTATVNSATGTDFNVTDLTAAVITGTSQSITIPSGGKTLFINFMLGIDYTGSPEGGGKATYEARLYIDGVATDCYLRTQETSAGTNTQFTINTVKFLTAGNHTLDVRMIRAVNNGTTSGVNMPCRPISMSFNASYIN